MSLKEQIKEVIGEIQKTGLRVVATVCDQGATNRAAINSLLEDTRTTCIKEDKEWSGGYFQLGNSKIYPIYDPPHLLKGIRNNLLNKDLIFEIDGEKGVAKWSHIEELYTRKPGFDDLRLVPKLTAEHVKPKFIPKMRVKHCAQVFSRTTSVALGFLAECGKLPDECKHTARLLRLFDDLFDSVNGSYHQKCLTLELDLEIKEYGMPSMPGDESLKPWIADSNSSIENGESKLCEDGRTEGGRGR
ncbi:unnamed protein product [Plutella xylostella]|uniref:(diamondback moth) hypothetical protein n=1 Tax=Plutella xylostella TaxID=51655 RepID=A0A8S4CX35_PLUXY|nr:unnamed protein product [Plutella xylostella]